LIGCLVVKELATPALPGAVLLVCAAPFASQQRNEIMKNNLRFVNRSAKFFSLRSALQNSSARPPINPATLVAAAFAARFVLRGGEY
ncbi:hypothetical protein SB751_26765, partial [Cupriavidus sp. SIMBA_020]|uniref:hypothetical protein n=1 Tax=Cupriavidus sp. SIMBA_020 TaxID=3085766 RepID=UPI00397DEA55